MPVKMDQRDSQAAAALMAWYLQAGVDETIGDAPIARYGSATEPRTLSGGRSQASLHWPPFAADAAPQPAGAAPPLPAPPLPETRLPAADRAVHDAIHLVAQASSLDDIRHALEVFDGCALKKTATNLVLCRGNPQARLVLVGEAPGAEEDRQGLPFVGPSGRLLDRMLASIGLGEESVLIANTVFWRPPGNRAPSQSETAACQPFLRRLLDVVDPDVVVALGGPASKVLLGRTEGVTKLRGRWFPLQTTGLTRPIQTTATFHPAYLLRSPTQKRFAWRDMLAIRQKLAETGTELARP